MNYFIWNKQLDFDRGLYENCIYRKGWLLAEDSSGGTYISRMADSLESQTLWHRATMDVKGAGDMSIRLSFYTSDVTEWNFGNGDENISEYLLNPKVPIYEKKEALKPFLRKTVFKTGDILLHECKGRYLWFIAELMPQGKEVAGISNMRIDFSAESWMQYLPEVYRKSIAKNDFLERFISVFQTEYQDLEESIRKSSAEIDPHLMPDNPEQEEFLRWMAGWIGIVDTNMWNRERLHTMMVNAPEIFKLRGTRKGVAKLIESFWGVQPIIVENFEIDRFRNNPERYESMVRIYGTDKSSFTLMLPARLVDTRQKKDTLELLMEAMTPAHMTMKVVPLRESVYLGSYTYLGVNTRISHINELRLYGQEYISFTTIAEEQGGKP